MPTIRDVLKIELKTMLPLCSSSEEGSALVRVQVLVNDLDSCMKAFLSLRKQFNYIVQHLDRPLKEILNETNKNNNKNYIIMEPIINSMETKALEQLTILENEITNLIDELEKSRLSIEQYSSTNSSTATQLKDIPNVINIYESKKKLSEMEIQICERINLIMNICKGDVKDVQAELDQIISQSSDTDDTNNTNDTCNTKSSSNKNNFNRNHTLKTPSNTTKAVVYVDTDFKIAANEYAPTSSNQNVMSGLTSTMNSNEKDRDNVPLFSAISPIPGFKPTTTASSQSTNTQETNLTNHTHDTKNSNQRMEERTSSDSDGKSPDDNNKKFEKNYNSTEETTLAMKGSTQSSGSSSINNQSFHSNEQASINTRKRKLSHDNADDNGEHEVENIFSQNSQ